MSGPFSTPLVTSSGGGSSGTPDGDSVQTDETCQSATYIDLATVGPSVSMSTGTEAIVTLSAASYSSVGVYDMAWMSVEVSGASSIVAIDDNSASTLTANVTGVGGDPGGSSLSRSFKVTGLTAGVNVFTAKYRNSGAPGQQVRFRNRSIVVEPR